jgi:hypothetical protein
MGWSIGWDSENNRDIGYGVPALCDYPGCNEEIDRGLSYRCGNINSDGGCGLYFCDKHIFHGGKHGQLCERCVKRRKSFSPKPDLLKWTYFKMVDPSWSKWREENKLTPKDLKMEKEWSDYGLVLKPVKCNCKEKIHYVECFFNGNNGLIQVNNEVCDRCNGVGEITIDRIGDDPVGTQICCPKCLGSSVDTNNCVGNLGKPCS